MFIICFVLENTVYLCQLFVSAQWSSKMVIKFYDIPIQWMAFKYRKMGTHACMHMDHENVIGPGFSWRQRYTHNPIYKRINHVLSTICCYSQITRITFSMCHHLEFYMTTSSFSHTAFHIHFIIHIIHMIILKYGHLNCVVAINNLIFIKR